MFDSLVKRNSGYFHNPKQACLLLGECEVDQYGHYVFRSKTLEKEVNTETRWVCDSQGVLFVEKMRNLNHTRRLIWERETPGRVPIQIHRSINKTQRKLKESKANIERILEMWNKGGYKQCFNESDYEKFYREDLARAVNTEMAMIKKLSELIKKTGNNSNV